MSVAEGRDREPDTALRELVDDLTELAELLDDDDVRRIARRALLILARESEQP